jgi:2-polyprenyl-3-methyl-5-hydroxy-6-metoxy-1,4-benzoquinol methylase
LAEKLDVDIIPILTQHSWETLPKGSWFVRPLQMDLKIYPRISPDDTTFGTSYSERCKAINKWYRTELEKFTNETQDNRYYIRKLKDGFMFKGAVVENYLRVKVRLENYYDYFDQIIPKKGKIVDVGCGYGFMSYMLWMKSPKRQITAYDYDEEKVQVGQNCYFNEGNVRFVAADALQVDFAPSDCFIVSDMLHYLSFENQLRLISNMTGRLNENGMIIIRDADKDNAKQTRFNKWIEFVSTRVIGFNKAENALEFVSFNKLADYATALGLSFEIVDNDHLTTNKLLILRNSRK